MTKMNPLRCSSILIGRFQETLRGTSPVTRFSVAREYVVQQCPTQTFAQRTHNNEQKRTVAIVLCYRTKIIVEFFTWKPRTTNFHTDISCEDNAYQHLSICSSSLLKSVTVSKTYKLLNSLFPKLGVKYQHGSYVTVIKGSKYGNTGSSSPSINS
jgi:hypothetical protein